MSSLTPQADLIGMPRDDTFEGVVDHVLYEVRRVVAIDVAKPSEAVHAFARVSPQPLEESRSEQCLFERRQPLLRVL